MEGWRCVTFSCGAQGRRLFAREEIYRCREVVDVGSPVREPDFAIFRLDRTVHLQPMPSSPPSRPPSPPPPPSPALPPSPPPRSTDVSNNTTSPDSDHDEVSYSGENKSDSGRIGKSTVHTTRETESGKDTPSSDTTEEDEGGFAEANEVTADQERESPTLFESSPATTVSNDDANSSESLQEGALLPVEDGETTLPENSNMRNVR